MYHAVIHSVRTALPQDVQNVKRMHPILTTVPVTLDISTLMELVYLVVTHFARLAIQLIPAPNATIMHQILQIAPATQATLNQTGPVHPAAILYVMHAAQPILVLNARPMLVLILQTANVFQATSS